MRGNPEVPCACLTLSNSFFCSLIALSRRWWHGRDGRALHTSTDRATYLCMSDCNRLVASSLEMDSAVRGLGCDACAGVPSWNQSLLTSAPDVLTSAWPLPPLQDVLASAALHALEKLCDVKSFCLKRAHAYTHMLCRGDTHRHRCMALVKHSS